MSIRYLFGKKKAYTDAETKTKEKNDRLKGAEYFGLCF